MADCRKRASRAPAPPDQVNADAQSAFCRLRRPGKRRILRAMTQAPEFLILTTADCEAVLARNHVGRLAFMNQRFVDIEPIGYVKQGDWLVFRSAYGSKLEALARKPYSAFEVDEVKGPFEWRSVVAHGTVYLLPEDGGPVERQQFERALHALRTVLPETLGPGDPTPEREVVYGLHIDRVSGRMARPPGSRGSRKNRKHQPVRNPPKNRGTPNGF